jgi:hypothetical protein
MITEIRKPLIPESENPPGRAPMAVFLLFVIALALRLIRLFELDLNFDEVVLLFQIDRSFIEIWNACKVDNFPPLYPWLLKIWGMVSHSDGWFRLFGALMGAGAAPAAFLLGREIGGKKLGWAAGLGTAASVSLIFYSQFVRMFNAQPMLTALSVYWFIRALKTDRSRYWILTGVTNLVGFYVYIFTVFLFVGELLVLIFYYRLDIKRYLRPFLANIPFFIGVIAWIGVLLARYTVLQEEGFWAVPFTWEEAVKVWVFLGTGNDFRDHYLITNLLNLPFTIGFFLGIWHSRRLEVLRIPAVVFLVVGALLMATSFFGQSFFTKPYFVFVLPLYLTVAFAGWLLLKSKFLRRFGMISMGVAFVAGFGYFQYDYYFTKEFWGFVRPRPYAQANEGHSLTTMIEDLTSRMRDGEIIVHYSDPDNHFRSFFPAVYYDQRVHPQVLFSRKQLTQYNGRQYLQSGDRIASLDDLQPPPKGIWLVTMANADDFFDLEVIAGRKHPRWVFEANFPAELTAAGYQLRERIQHGKLTALHYVKKSSATTTKLEMNPGNLNK